MSSVNNVGNNSPIYTVNRTGPRPVSAPSAGSSSPVRGQDSVELSGNTQGVGQMLKTLKAGGDVRADKVAQIKAQIAAGQYETDEKLDAATDKLLDEVFGG
ncbi:MAG TPA: flagellar biosynthesis anti-sigma factor FlgM [Humisphaera sp.]